jgi:hypothetical protein
VIERTVIERTVIERTVIEHTVIEHTVQLVAFSMQWPTAATLAPITTPARTNPPRNKQRGFETPRHLGGREEDN